MAINTSLPTTLINVVYTTTNTYRDVLRSGAAAFGDIVIDAANNTFHTHGHTFYFVGSDYANSVLNTDEQHNLGLNSSINALFMNKVYIAGDEEGEFEVQSGENGIYYWTKRPNESDGYPIMTFNEDADGLFINFGQDVFLNLSDKNDIIIEGKSVKEYVNQPVMKWFERRLAD